LVHTTCLKEGPQGSSVMHLSPGDSSKESSAGLNKFGLSTGPRFDSGLNPVNSNQYGFEPIDPQARVRNYCFQ